MEENNKLVRSLNSTQAEKLISNQEKGALQLNSNTDSLSQARPGPPTSKDAQENIAPGLEAKQGRENLASAGSPIL